MIKDKETQAIADVYTQMLDEVSVYYSYVYYNMGANSKVLNYTDEEADRALTNHFPTKYPGTEMAKITAKLLRDGPDGKPAVLLTGTREAIAALIKTGDMTSLKPYRPKLAHDVQSDKIAKMFPPGLERRRVDTRKMNRFGEAKEEE